ncbi:MAG: PEP-CTERM sorting domain-containing protein [Gammaproteobacteria bacterium]
MKARMLISQAVLAATALLFASAAAAALALVDCVTTPGAIANSMDPAYCAMGTMPNDSPATEAGAVNAVFDPVLGTTADPFFFIGKYDKQSGIDSPVAGFSLTATGAESPWDYAFQLITSYAGQKVDFVLMVKQPGGEAGETNVAYAWTGLVLDIDGFYNSFRADYSHISGFIRGVQDIPEPGVLLLLGTGLLGFALVRRRIARAETT